MISESNFSLTDTDLEKSKKGKPFDPLKFLARRLPVILGLAIPIWVVVAFLVNTFVLKKNYETASVVMVLPAKATGNITFDFDVGTGVDTFINTLITRASDRKLITEAIKTIPEDQLPSFISPSMDSDVASLVFQSHLQVQRVPNTTMIQFIMKAKSPKGLDVAANALVLALRKKLQNEQRDQYVARLDYLHNEKTKLAILLTEQQISKLKSTQAGLAPTNPDLLRSQAAVDSLKKEVEEFRELYAKNIELTSQQMKNSQIDNAVNTAGLFYDTAADEAARNVIDQAAAAQTLEGLSTGQVAAAPAPTGPVKAIISLEDRIQAISQKIDDVTLDSIAPLNVAIISRATPVDTPAPSSKLKQRMIYILILLVAVFSTLVLVVERLDKTIRTSRDLGATTGSQSSWCVPFPDGKTPSEYETTMLAVTLMKYESSKDLSKISFLSCHEGSGNTALALEVSRYMSSLGRKVLLVELPTKSPELLDAASFPAWVPSELEDEPPILVKDLMSDVTMIPWRNYFSATQANRSIKGFIDAVVPNYDFLIMVLAPLTTSSISIEISAQSDVVVVSAALGKALYSEAKNTVDWLVKENVSAISPVLTFSDRKNVDALHTILREFFQQLIASITLRTGRSKRGKSDSSGNFIRAKS